ncbi:MAG TPA: nuclear transport factor 2 family protein [Nitrososphaera sp.]
MANDKYEESNTQQSNLGAVFDQHIKHEFEDHDVDATMQTMTKEPYVHHVPVMTGGVGYAGVYDFYKNHFVGKTPPDTKIVPISRTIGEDQVVDEIIISFTHDREIDFILPGIPATGKYVELPLVLLMKFKDGKISYEHVYWDQASLLVQVGLLDPSTLPITGQEQAKRLLELSQQAANVSGNTHDRNQQQQQQQ